MRHAMLHPAQRDRDLTLLDEMIASLKPLPEAELLIEHLNSARLYLLGAMPEEYLIGLESARNALASVTDSGLHAHLDETIAKLIAEMSNQAKRS
jgi:hypothetical protein